MIKFDTLIGLLAHRSIPTTPLCSLPNPSMGSDSINWTGTGPTCTYGDLGGTSFTISGSENCCYRIDYTASGSNGQTLCNWLGLQILATGDISETCGGVISSTNYNWAANNGNARDPGAQPGSGNQSSFFYICGNKPFSFTVTSDLGVDVTTSINWSASLVGSNCTSVNNDGYCVSNYQLLWEDEYIEGVGFTGNGAWHPYLLGTECVETLPGGVNTWIVDDWNGLINYFYIGSFSNAAGIGDFDCEMAVGGCGDVSALPSPPPPCPRLWAQSSATINVTYAPEGQEGCPPLGSAPGNGTYTPYWWDSYENEWEYRTDDSAFYIKSEGNGQYSFRLITGGQWGLFAACGIGALSCDENGFFVGTIVFDEHTCALWDWGGGCHYYSSGSVTFTPPVIGN